MSNLQKTEFRDPKTYVKPPRTEFRDKKKYVKPPGDRI